jgi:hypothetical protein
MQNIKDNWNNESIQFARLLSEISAAGIDWEMMNQLCQSMNATQGEIEDILNRADARWELIKDQMFLEQTLNIKD